MALAQEKKGGPYTKHDQKERKDKVYNLHFEKGYSALKIAEMLHVNRNTINEDIKDLYVKEAEGLPYHNPSLLLKQIQRLETQQARLLEELEKCTEFKDKVNIEKLLFAINSKITFHVSKIVFHSYDVFDRLRNSANNEPFDSLSNLFR
jgi:predicted DNA-binding protein YlxM (UPF0122 family)